MNESTRYSWQNLVKLNFLDRLSKNIQISNFIKTSLVRAELFHADGRTGRHHEADSRFSQF